MALSHVRSRASDQLPRQWTLFRLLQQAAAPGLTVKELADQLGAPKSNVERDLRSLQEAGFQLTSVTDPRHSQRVRWRAEAQEGPVQVPGFGTAELMALHAALSALAFMKDTPIHKDLTAVQQKVRAALAHSQGKAVARLSRVFMAHPRDHAVYSAPDKRAILDDLLDAVARQRKARLTYEGATSGRKSVSVVHPLRVFVHHGALYLLAVPDGKKDEVRTYAVHRMTGVERLKDGFRPPAVNEEQLAARAFGVFQEAPQQIEVIFEAETARYVMERSFHPAEHKERLPDGRIRYQVTAGGRHEVVAWVLGFGGSARLVKPQAWTEDLRVKAQLLLRAHAD
jgi:predicted DNA-binding transcriptional regulator YafY